MTYLIFLFLVLLLNIKYNKRLYLIFLIIILLFVGLRENVGLDYSIDFIIFKNMSKVKGYFTYFFSYILQKNGINFYGFTLLYSFLTIILCHIFLKKNLKEKKKIRTGWYIYILDYGMISSLNVMRQGVANFIYLLSLREKNKKLILFLFILGYGFHKSIILLLIFLPIVKIKFNIKFLKIVLILSLIVTLTIDLQKLFVEVIMPNLGYYGKIYLRKDLIHYVIVEQEIGLGKIFRILMSSLMIFFYEDLIKKNHKNLVYINSSILWGILTILTYKIFIISRVLEYLYLSSLISYPLLIEEIKNKKYGKYIVFIIWLIFFSLYLKATVFSDISQKLIPYNNILF